MDFIHRNVTGRKLTAKDLKARYRVCDRTLDRWVAAGVLPKPMKMLANGWRYWDEAEVLNRERQRMAARATA